jgi:hypothetical protein
MNRCCETQLLDERNRILNEIARILREHPARKINHLFLCELEDVIKNEVQP